MVERDARAPLTRVVVATGVNLPKRLPHVAPRPV